MEEVSAILLGAGESKRMGVNKLSLPWCRETIFEHCLETLLRSKVKEVIVVLNDRTKKVVERVKAHKVKVVNNPYPRMGMGHSIRKGLKAIGPNSQGILIALGDQPWVKTRTINALIHAFLQGKGTIVIPSFQGKQGHPVIFHRQYLKGLLKLRGDVGGRSVIEKHPEEVWLARVKSEGVIKDIDTWEDYRKIVKSYGLSVKSTGRENRK
jgi:molybdenum cofactor cytidylyltransferase